MILSDSHKSRNLVKLSKSVKYLSSDLLTEMYETTSASVDKAQFRFCFLNYTLIKAAEHQTVKAAFSWYK